MFRFANCLLMFKRRSFVHINVGPKQNGVMKCRNEGSYILHENDASLFGFFAAIILTNYLFVLKIIYEIQKLSQTSVSTDSIFEGTDQLNCRPKRTEEDIRVVRCHILILSTNSCGTTSGILLLHANFLSLNSLAQTCSV